MPKRHDNAGYRLHKERIIFSGGQIIRTIKYPLKPLNNSQENQDFFNKIKELVIADDLKIRGDINLNDYLNYSDKKIDCYSVLDFWVDSLKAGVIWSSDATRLIELIRQINNVDSPIDRIWSQSTTIIKQCFEKNKFKEILMAKSIRVNKKKNSFKDFLTSCLKNDKEFENDKVDISLKDKKLDCKKLIDEIVNSFYNEQGQLILTSKKQQDNFWLQNYNLDKKLLEEEKSTSKYKDITFIIIPDLIRVGQVVNLENLIDDRKKWLESFEKNDENTLLTCLGLTNNFNGFSNYFGTVLKGLQENEIEPIYEAQKKILPQLESKKEIIINALTFLSEKAKILKQPTFPFASHWADYRSIFGGKLLSWASNYLRRNKEINKQIDSFKTSLSESIKFLQEKKFSEEAEKEKEVIIDLMKSLKIFFEDKEKSILKSENYEVFNIMLSSVKRKLNLFYQAYLQKRGDDETKIDDFSPFTGLFEKIYQPVAFYGEKTKKHNKKIVNETIPIIKSGIDNILKLSSYLKDNFTPKIFFEACKNNNSGTEESEQKINYQKLLQFLWNKYKDNAINSADFRDKYQNILQENLADPKWELLIDKKNKDRFVFYKNPYVKGTLAEVKIKDGQFEDKFEKLVLELLDFLKNYDKEILLKNNRILIDWIELSKKIVTLLIKFNKNNYYSLDFLKLNVLVLDNFDIAKNYLNLFSKNQINKNELSFLVHSLIFSELRGAATIYSKREYTAQYTLQFIAIENELNILYQPLSQEVKIDLSLEKADPRSEIRKNLMLPHRYIVFLGKINKKSQKNLPNFIKLEKKKITPCFIDDADLKKTGLLRISSSPYQTQFLDKYLYRPKNWEGIDIEMHEYSLIVEKKYEINWDLTNNKPQLKPYLNGKKDRLYLAVPFGLIPLNYYHQSKLGKIVTDNEKDRLKYPILGVDVGEYGLAYCLVKFDYVVDNKFTIRRIDIEDKGFIEDKNIAKIKDKFSEIQQKSKQGIFNREDTTVSRVRENAVGVLRNKLHWILTQKTASSIYESSISNFETGSGRTVKIYNSVKRADTEFKTDADKQIHNHIWGKNTKFIGRNVSAYGSSYTCIKCLRSLYQIRTDDLEKSKVNQREGNIITITTPYGEVKAYSLDKNQYLVGKTFKASDEELKNIQKIIRDFTRPPVSKNSEVLNKFAPELLRSDWIENFRKRRGNSAIFVCPFCQFVVDADIQAAFMMAVRGYLRFSGIVKPKPVKDKKSSDKNKEETTGDSFIKATIEYLKNVERKELIDKLSLISQQA